MQTSADRQLGHDQAGNVIDVRNAIDQGLVTERTWHHMFETLKAGWVPHKISPQEPGDLLGLAAALSAATALDSLPSVASEAGTLAHEKSHADDIARTLRRASRTEGKRLRGVDLGDVDTVTKEQAGLRFKGQVQLTRQRVYSAYARGFDADTELRARLAGVRSDRAEALELLSYVEQQQWASTDEIRDLRRGLGREMRQARRDVVRENNWNGSR